MKCLRGPEWDRLVEQAQQAPETSPENLSFVLMMVNLNGCTNCNADSFKAMRGCVACSVQTLERFISPDEDLLKRFQKAAGQIENYLSPPK